MVKRQHRTSSSSTSAQIRKPAVITRSRRNQNTELEQQKRFAFDMKRKRKSDIEADVPENDDIERQSPSYSNSNIVDSIKLKDKEPILSPSKRAKLSTMVGYNNNQFDIDDNIQTNVEIRGIKAENGIREGVRDSVHHRETLRNGIESRHMVQSSIKNGFDNVKEVTKDIAKNEDQINKQEDYKITEDNICNIEMIIDNFKDVIEIMGTQMVIGNYVIEYSDYQKFLTLLNKLMDILEMYDSDKILQSAKKIGCKRNTGQVLNSNLFRTKISKRAYKCLNEFQDDFICTCNDAIDANPEKYDAGMNFLKFGARLFEQAYKELPNGIRQLCDHDDATKSTFTKSQQKVALVQPTLDGYVFSSGTIKQSPENYSFQLVGDLQDMVIVPTQSMDEEDIPTLGSILPKIGNHEFELPERRVSGVKFHKYKAYASFAPIYDSGAAMLSYEDTILARTYKKHHRVSKNIDDSDDSDLSEEEEEELSDEDMMVSDHEGTSQTESFDIALSNKQKHSDEEIGQAEKFEIASPSKQTNSGEQISQAEKFEIASSSKQINSVEENSKTESIEIASSSKQNNPGEEIIQPERHEIISSSKQNNSGEEISQTESHENISSSKQNNTGEEINQMEGLEIALSNKQTNSGEEIIQAEIHEITSNKPINSSEEINQTEGLKISSSSKQTNSGEEITQAESHENTPSSKQINSREEIIQTERHENNTGEEISQMEGLEITSSNRQTCSDEKISQVESTSSSKQTDSRDYIIIENNHTNDEKLFEDIDVNLLYKSVEKEGNDIDKILDENVEIFKKVQLIQEKRLIQSSHIISTKERELAIKLQNKLANIISEVSPSDIVSLDSIEYAMDNLLIKEAFFKGTLPPDKSFAHPTNEVSRDAFVSFSGVEKSSEDMEQAEYPRNDVNVSTTQMKSEEALPQVSLAGPSPLTPHSVSHTIPQSVSSQSLHHSTSHPLPISASMTYPQPSRAQVPMRMPYGSSQVMPASYQMTYSRPPSHVPPYYHHPSQRYHPSYGYSYYPQYSSYTMSHSTWQQRPSYY